MKTIRKKPERYLWLVASLVLLPGAIAAATVQKIRSADELQTALQDAETGTELVLQAGRYAGNFVIDRSVRLRANGKVVLTSDGQGTILTINAASSVVRGIAFVDSGHNITNQDACILVNPGGYGSKLIDNTMNNCGWGVWVERAGNVEISHNAFTGGTERIVSDRGNGIQLFNVEGGRVTNNKIRLGRDGVYISNSKGVFILNNDIADLRFGIHYMYSDGCTVSGNEVRNSRIGAALMYSKYLVVEGNTLHYNKQHGILMRDILYSDLFDNVSNHNHDGLYLGSSYFNYISGNTFSENEIAAEVSNGSKDNHVSRNRFINNRMPVKFMDEKSIEWSVNGVGNYWSEYRGWDRNHDGIGDRPYIVTRLTDKLLYQFPVLKLIFSSPAFQLLSKIENSFPVLRGAAIIDSAPLLKGTL